MYAYLWSGMVVSRRHFASIKLYVAPLLGNTLARVFCHAAPLTGDAGKNRSLVCMWLRFQLPQVVVVFSGFLLALLLFLVLSPSPPPPALCPVEFE